MTRWLGGGGGGVTEMLTACVAGALTLSESDAVKVAVPLKPPCTVTVNVAWLVPCPAVTLTSETPVPATADQLAMLLSSEPGRPTLNGAACWSTAAIGLAGALMTGTLFTTLHGGTVVDVLRGAGVPTVKSFALLSVSVQPPALRNVAL